MWVILFVSAFEIGVQGPRLTWVTTQMKPNKALFFSFIVNESSSSSLPVRLQENVMDLSADRGLKMAHAEKSLTEFWCDVEKEHVELGKRALNERLPFGSTYVCEVTFSAWTHIKTKLRKRLQLWRTAWLQLLPHCPLNFQSLWRMNKLNCLIKTQVT